MSDQQLAQIIWDYMRYEQPIDKADVIIGLGTHDTRTAEWCAKLYHEHWAPRIIFCGGRGRLTGGLEGNEADRFAEVAIGLGVPAEVILRDIQSTNTGENIVNAYHILQKQGINPTKVILSTKPYMLRRAYATFMKQWPGESTPEVICSAIDRDLQEYGKDLKAITHTIQIMIGDLQRIREYPKLGFQIEQDIPKDVWDAYEELVRRGYTEQLMR